MNIYLITQEQLNNNIGIILPSPTFPYPYRFWFFITQKGEYAIIEQISIDFNIKGVLSTIDDNYIITPLYKTI